MENPIAFGDHTVFHRQVLRLTLTGAALGLAAHVVQALLGPPGEVLQTVGLGLGAAALGLAAAPPRRSALIRALGFALLVGGLGALCFLALSRGTPRYPWFGLWVYGLGLGVIAGRALRDARRFLLPLATGLSVALGSYVVVTFDGRVNFVDYVPAFAALPAYGALFGFLASIGLVVQQLQLQRDPVTQAHQEIRLSLSGEMADLCQRAVDLYQRVVQVLQDREAAGSAGDAELRKSVEQLVLRIFALARRWQEVEREAGRTSAGELASRIEELDRKIEGTSDRVARKQYAMAREALGSQLRYLRDISRNRERVTAQVYNYLAALERLNLAVLNHRGADAAKLADEIGPILDEIDAIGTEMDIASDTLAELSEVGLPESGERYGEGPGEPRVEPSPPSEPEAAGTKQPEAEAEPPQAAQPEAEAAAPGAAESSDAPDLAEPEPRTAAAASPESEAEPEAASPEAGEAQSESGPADAEAKLNAKIFDA